VKVEEQLNPYSSCTCLQLKRLQETVNIIALRPPACRGGQLYRTLPQSPQRLQAWRGPLWARCKWHHHVPVRNTTV